MRLTLSTKQCGALAACLATVCTQPILADGGPKDKPTVIWAKWRFEPNFITEGPYQGKGWGDILQATLAKNLPEYNHQIVFMNLPRMLEMYKEKKSLMCTVDMVSHADLDFDDYLSVAEFPFLGHMLVTTKEKAHLFGKKGDVIEARKAIANEKLRMIYAKGRPYMKIGDELTAYLAGHPDASHLMETVTSNVTVSPFHALLNNRADYTFEYADKVDFRFKNTPEADRFEFFEVKESAGWFYCFASCTRVPEGKTVIKKINEIIRRERAKPEWREQYIQWMPKPEIREKMRRFYQKIFLQKGDIHDSNPRSSLD